MAAIDDIFKELEDEEFPWRDYIERRPGVMVGKPVFKGTRLTVEHVLQELANGMTWQALIQSYPNLTSERIKAALHFAAWLSREHRLKSDQSSQPAEEANERKVAPLAD